MTAVTTDAPAPSKAPDAPDALATAVHQLADLIAIAGQPAPNISLYQHPSRISVNVQISESAIASPTQRIATVVAWAKVLDAPSQVRTCRDGSGIVSVHVSAPYGALSVYVWTPVPTRALAQHIESELAVRELVDGLVSA